MTDAPERMPNRSAAHMALMDYQQADMDGIMVLVSRQAIHEVSDEIESQAARIEELEGALREIVKQDDCYETSIDWVHAINRARAALSQTKEDG